MRFRMTPERASDAATITAIVVNAWAVAVDLLGPRPHGGVAFNSIAAVLAVCALSGMRWLRQLSKEQLEKHAGFMRKLEADVDLAEMMRDRFKSGHLDMIAEVQVPTKVRH